VRAVGVLVRRELRLFVRQRSRLVGTLAQAGLIWGVLALGLAHAGGGTGEEQLNVLFPGVVVMMLLLSGISATMSVIEDRHRGFLQGVLAAPGPRASLALGKCLGGTAVSLIPAALLVLVAGAAGYRGGEIAPAATLASLALTSLLFTGLGFVIAWRLDSSQGYHVVMSVVLFPLWILSGALAPSAEATSSLGWAARLNPMTYSVYSLRDALLGDPRAVDLAVLAALAAAALAAACVSARKGGI